MTAFTLKLIACLSMLLDHIGYYLYSSNMSFFLRGIGRLAMPIYAFFIAEGYRKTKSKKKYALRLLVFAIISEIPFDSYFFGTSVYPYYQNIFFTLLAALLAIWAYDKLKEKGKPSVLGLAAVLLFCFIADLFSTDYGSTGVLTCFIFYYFNINTKNGKTAVAVSMAVLFALEFIENPGNSFILLQALRLLSLPLLFMYNGVQTNLKSPEMIKYTKWFFYVFYPLHLLILRFIFL